MPNAWEALVAKKWSELEALEQDGRVLYPDAIRSRGKGGVVKEVPICHPRAAQRRAAQGAGRRDAWAKDEKLDRDRDPGLFDDMDTLCILARAIREPTAPYDQKTTYRLLESTYDMRSLDELWSKYKIYEDLTDPRDGIQTDAEFWAVVGAMGRTRNILPLTECESHEQNSCILRLVDLALTSPTFKSFCTRSRARRRRPDPGRACSDHPRVRGVRRPGPKKDERLDRWRPRKHRIGQAHAEQRELPRLAQANRQGEREGREAGGVGVQVVDDRRAEGREGRRRRSWRTR
jgi:hypothetical protein